MASFTRGVREKAQRAADATEAEMLASAFAGSQRALNRQGVLWFTGQTGIYGRLDA